MSLQIITDVDVDQTAARQVMAKHGFCAPFQPNRVTRTEDRNGLLCHRDEELCFSAVGEGDIKALLEEPLINDVLEAPKVELA